MAGVAGGARLHAPLGGEEATPYHQDAAHFGESTGQVRPVVHGRERPRDVHPVIGQGKGFDGPLPPHDGPLSVVPARHAEHRLRRVDSNHLGPPLCGPARRDSGTAADVDEARSGAGIGESNCELGIAGPPPSHAQSRDPSGDPGESPMVAMVVRRQDRVILGRPSHDHELDS